MKLVYLLLVLLIGCSAVERGVVMNVRESAVAGSWYPGTASEVNSAIKDMCEDASIDGEIKALIVPHAGWRFSGSVACSAYALLKGRSYETVIVIAPSHHAGYSGASIADVTHYETPLGNISLSPKVEGLRKEKFFTTHPTAHSEEHSLEIQLPFLQHFLGEFSLIPVLIGAESGAEEIKSIAASLKSVVDESTLVVVSSDFTHYGTGFNYVPFENDIPSNLEKLDGGAIEKIVDKDVKGFMKYVDEKEATICGRLPIAVLMYMFPDISVKRLEYTTSGSMTGDYSHCVSYASLVFYQDGFTPSQKSFLLKLARDTLEMYVKEGKTPEVTNVDERLRVREGCFVTLNKDGELRGCIGNIMPHKSLYEAVIDNAVNAAVHDPRFDSVSEDELKDIEIEISVLSVPKKLHYMDSDDLLEKLVPLKHGVVLEHDGRNSTFLPQVWEQLPDKEQFLSQLCLKQGSSASCWKDPKTRIELYSATVFKE